MGLQPLPALLVILLLGVSLAAVGSVVKSWIGTPEERRKRRQDIAKTALADLDQQVSRTQLPSDLYFYLSTQHRKGLLPGVQDFMFKVLSPHIFGQQEADRATLDEVVIYVRGCLQDTINSTSSID